MRQYAQYMGITLLAIGVFGLMFGEQSLLQLINLDLMENIIHLLTGGAMAYIGYSSRDCEGIKGVVGGVGFVYLLVGMVGFIAPTLFGMLPHGYSLFDNVLHLTLGIVGILVAFEALETQSTLTKMTK